MRITFKGEGGFAALPALALPVTFDVEALPSSDQSELRELVERSRFFTLPPRITDARAGAADLPTYTITIEEAARAHTVTVSDPLPPGSLRALVDRLRLLAAISRRRGTSGTGTDADKAEGTN